MALKVKRVIKTEAEAIRKSIKATALKEGKVLKCKREVACHGYEL